MGDSESRPLHNIATLVMCCWRKKITNGSPDLTALRHIADDATQEVLCWAQHKTSKVQSAPSRSLETRAHSMGSMN